MITHEEAVVIAKDHIAKEGKERHIELGVFHLSG